MAMEDEDDELICRYCFVGTEEGELISPCKCAGGQQYVHLTCLRRWQRMVVVGQPTHPAFHDRDIRHSKCNVCNSEFTCPPPTRQELMESFTGPEIAALIDEGCVIGAHETFSTTLRGQLQEMPTFMRRSSSYDHWINGCYLITSVEEERGQVSLPISDASTLQQFRMRLDDQLGFSLRGRRMRLACQAALADATTETIKDMFANISVPCTVVLEPEEATNCGDDHVVAVDLTRVIEPCKPQMVKQAVQKVVARYPSAAKVQITHFVGGPCDDDELVSCIVPGGGGKGWTVKQDLSDAILLAHTRAAKRTEAQGDIGGGQTVRLTGLVSCPELNGEEGLTLRFDESKGRWMVRLRNGEGKLLKPANLEALEGSGGRVFAFWGDARWSRAQLLGEIARGHWGLSRAGTSELTRPPTERWANLGGRLVFAPVTDMTEDFMREGHQEMIAARAAMQLQGLEARDEEDDGDGL